MSVVDLTDTKWVLNDSINNTFLSTKNITFTSNSNTYSTIYRSFLSDLGEDFLDYGSLTVYSEVSWENQAYRTISITGGTDATNTDLITWFEANAVQVPVVDLSGTSWVLNDNLALSPLTNGIYFSLSFTSNGDNFNYIGLNSFVPGSEAPEPHVMDFYLIYDLNDYPVYEDSWIESAYKPIFITSGTDVTNPDLIAWLSQNATYQQPSPSESDISFGNLSISSMSFGALEVSALYFGSYKLYEASSNSTPAEGYTIVFNCDSNVDALDVALNGGIEITYPATSQTITFNNVTSISVRFTPSSGYNMCSVTNDQEMFNHSYSPSDVMTYNPVESDMNIWVMGEYGTND